MSGKLWTAIIEKADLYKQLDQLNHYLDSGSLDYPWEYVVRCCPGGSHRLGIATSVWFEADHPSGLSFKWSFDIEPHTANGSSYYQVDTAGISDVLRKLPMVARIPFQKYLAECAVKIREQAAKYQEIADRERKTADLLAGYGGLE